MECGWIVDDLVQRILGRVGTFHALDWRRFLEVIGLECRRIDGLPVPALLFRDAIFVRDGLDVWTTAWYVWHEVAHVLLHCGSQTSWGAMACGDLILRKQERQAEEFARFFPDWSAG